MFVNSNYLQENLEFLLGYCLAQKFYQNTEELGVMEHLFPANRIEIDACKEL